MAGSLYFKDSNIILSSGSLGFFGNVGGDIFPFGSGSGGGSVANVVYQTGTQTISGTKTFVNSVVFPTSASFKTYFGSANNPTGSRSQILGGFDNTADGSYSFIGNGLSNLTSGLTSAILNGDGNSIYSDYSIIGGGGQNLIGSGASYSVLVGGQSNTLSGEMSTIGGGSINILRANYATIAGGTGNTLTGQSFGYAYGSVIGGGTINTIRDSNHSTIGGGSENAIVWEGAEFSTIGGGQFNGIDSSLASVIAGGFSNDILSGTNYCFIGGGIQHDITAGGEYSSVVGGRTNRVSGSYSFVGGGRGNNILSGTHFGTVLNGSGNVSMGFASTILNGVRNTGSADYSIILNGSGTSISSGCAFSLAAGRQATVTHSGAAVFKDSQNRTGFSKGNDSVFFDYAGGLYATNAISLISGTGYHFMSGDSVLTKRAEIEGRMFKTFDAPFGTWFTITGGGAGSGGGSLSLSQSTWGIRHLFSITSGSGASVNVFGTDATGVGGVIGPRTRVGNQIMASSFASADFTSKFYVSAQLVSPSNRFNWQYNSFGIAFGTHISMGNVDHSLSGLVETTAPATNNVLFGMSCVSGDIKLCVKNGTAATQYSSVLANISGTNTDLGKFMFATNGSGTVSLYRNDVLLGSMTGVQTGVISSGCHLGINYTSTTGTVTAGLGEFHILNAKINWE